MNPQQDTIDTLKGWSLIACEREAEFLERFCHGGFMLANRSWNGCTMHFTYILRSGQHVADSIKMDEWLDFVNTRKNAANSDYKGFLKQFKECHESGRVHPAADGTFDCWKAKGRCASKHCRKVHGV